MQKFSLFLIATILPLLSFSQSLFEQFENMDKVSSVVVNKNMINLLTSFGMNESDQETKDFLELAKGLISLKVFITEDEKASAKINSAVSKYLKSSKLEELMRLKDRDVNVKFYVMEGKKDNHSSTTHNTNVKELLMFVSGIENVKEAKINNRQIETVLLTLTGEIDLDKISALTSKMNLPKQLNNASKSK